jgi:hypothetical protein
MISTARHTDEEHTMTTSDTFSIVTAAAVLFVMAASTI